MSERARSSEVSKQMKSRLTEDRLVVVDGATGYVGSNFVKSACQRREAVVALSRGDPKRTFAAIASAVLSEDRVESIEDCVEVVDYQLERPNLGLDDAKLRQLFNRPCDYWHFAAKTSLSPMGQGEFDVTNVGGTQNTLDVFCRYAQPESRYFLVSTAYSCGLVNAPVREEWHPDAAPSAFRTYYEATKRTAEHLFRTTLETRGIQGAVLRLGQVVGSSVTGRTTSDYGIYDVLRALRRLTRGRPNQKVRVGGARDATLSLVPIDRCIAWLREISTAQIAEFDPPIFHVVDKEPVPVHRFTTAVGRYLPVSIHIVPEEEMGGETRTLLERLLAARMTYTGKYVSHRIDFLRDNLQKVTGHEAAVAVTDEVLDRLIRIFLVEEGGE